MNLFGRKSSPDSTAAPRRRNSSEQSSSGSEDRSSRSGSGSVTFRRGRTLTGSISPNIRSTTETSATMMSPRAHVHHLTKRRQSLAWRFVAVAVLFVILYLGVSQLIATVDVRIADDASVEQTKRAEYAVTLQQYYDRYPSQRFYPVLNRTELVEYMQQMHPEVDSANVSLSGNFGHGQLSVTLRKPIVRWTIAGKNEFVDAGGNVFEVNGYRIPSVQIIDKTGISDDQGVVTSRRFLSFVGSVAGDMTDKGYTVTQASIPLLTTRQLQLNIKSVPYPIKLTIDRSAGEQTEDAIRVIRYLKSKKIRPSYIDVRVQGKAFYK